MATIQGSSSSELWLALQRCLDTSRNWDLSRPYAALLSERQEGFTEVFHHNDDNNQNKKKQHAAFASCWKQELESVQTICATPHPSLSPHVPIRLIQYRAAWLEQLVLRVAGLPHVVVNSSYAVTEACGPLPILQDFGGATTQKTTTTGAGAQSQQRPPAMTGRMNRQRQLQQQQEAPSMNADSASSEDTTATDGTAAPAPSPMTGKNAILDYLAMAHGVDLDQPLKTASSSSPQLQHQSALLCLLIVQQLEPCRAVLQFQDDAAWNQIHRVRCLQAGTDSQYSHSSFWPSGRIWTRITAAFQARSERLFQRSSLSLSPEYRALSTPQAIERARAAYQILEDTLLQQQQQQDDDHPRKNKKAAGPCFLLGTSQPTTVDVLLWDHLMQALTDVYLVVVLADFPALVQFVQGIWNQYFVDGKENDNGSGNGGGDDDKGNDWRTWNAQQNATNAFCQVPSLIADDTTASSADDTDTTTTAPFRHAIELMEQLFVRERNLGESLLVAKQARSLQQQQTKQQFRHRPLETWHRWRMGGPLYPPQPGDHDEDTTNTSSRPDLAGQQEEKIRTEYKRNDELWMSTVAAGTVCCMLLFGMAQHNNHQAQ